MFALHHLVYGSGMSLSVLIMSAVNHYSQLIQTEAAIELCI